MRVGERLPWCRCSADALLLFEFRDKRKLCRRIPGMRAVGERAYFTPVKETLGAGLRAAGKVQAVQPDPAILRRPGRAEPNRGGACLPSQLAWCRPPAATPSWTAGMDGAKPGEAAPFPFPGPLERYPG